MESGYEVVEGLVVDTIDGGVGFRNHTIPPALPFGETWSEHLLFIEPETQCVDMNITLDFTIPYEYYGRGGVQKIKLTDRGGFANFVREPPSYDQTKAWENADLKNRAHAAAWLSNVYTMYYLNITNPKNKQHAQRFQYVNSNVGKTFIINEMTDIDIPIVEPLYEQPQISSSFGNLLNVVKDFVGNSTPTSRHPNPFNVSIGDFNNITRSCSSQDDGNLVNISNIVVCCGTVYGAARRQDGSDAITFDPGTNWTVPMYACASAAKASIKTVSFRYNGTAGLRSLEVVAIKPYSYASNDDKPLWAVENLQLALSFTKPVWGITLPRYADYANITTVRQEHLYLPGSPLPDLEVGSTNQYFAGTDFYSDILSTAYESNDNLHYTGRDNLAMQIRWKEYSHNAATVAQIINLIWTDMSANAVVGTRSQLSREPERNLQTRGETQTTIEVPIVIYTRRVRFQPLYGIPAFIVLALVVPIAVGALVFVILGRARPASVRRYLNHTSAGRLLATLLYPDDCPPGITRATWVRLAGGKRVDLGGIYPLATDTVTGVALDSSADPQTGETRPTNNIDDIATSMHVFSSPAPCSPVTDGGDAQSESNHDADHVSHASVLSSTGTLSLYSEQGEYGSTNNISPLSARHG